MSYKTKQKDIILEYLKNNNDKCMSINEIYIYIQKTNKIGLTTIYRYLNNLINEGIIKKYIDSNSKEAVFQYCKDNDCNNHIHLKCNKCGHIIHLDCEAIDSLNNHLLSEHNFIIDNATTTICGICEECKNEKN